MPLCASPLLADLHGPWQLMTKSFHRNTKQQPNDKTGTNWKSDKEALISLTKNSSLMINLLSIAQQKIVAIHMWCEPLMGGSSEVGKSVQFRFIGTSSVDVYEYMSSYSTVVLYIGIMKVRGFWPQIITQNQLDIYFLTVWEYFLGIAKPKNIFRSILNPYIK